MEQHFSDRLLVVINNDFKDILIKRRLIDVLSRNNFGKLFANLNESHLNLYLKEFPLLSLLHKFFIFVRILIFLVFLFSDIPEHTG